MNDRNTLKLAVTLTTVTVELLTLDGRSLGDERGLMGIAQEDIDSEHIKVFGSDG